MATVLQTASANTGSLTTNFNSTPYSISASFPSPLTSGSAIVVILGFNSDNISFVTGIGVTDSQLNTYSPISNTRHTTGAGPGLAILMAADVGSGGNTVTVDCSVGWDGFGSYTTAENTILIIAEIAGLGSSPSVQGVSANQRNGSLTGSPMSITDSLATVVTLNVTGQVNYECWCLIDLLGGGADFVFACGIAGGIVGDDTLSWTPPSYAAAVLTSNSNTADTTIHTSPPEPTFLVLYATSGASSLAVDCGSPPDGTVGTSYSHTFPASGGTPPYTFSVLANTLPPGLAIDPATGIVFGVPLAAGTFSFVVDVTDSASGTASVSCSITIAGMTLGCGATPNGTVGVAYDDQLVVTDGVPPYTFTILSGSLPPGLTLNPATGEITGTPTTPGTYCFTVQVTEGAPPAGTGGFTNQRTVTVVHGLNSTSLSPGVWDDSGNVIKFGTVKLTDANNAVLTFPTPQSGSFKLSADTFQQGFVGETSVDVPHGLNSLNLIPVVYDGANNVIDFDTFELVDVNNAVLTFATAQDGNLVILLPAGAYSQTFAAGVSIPVAHNLNATLLRVAVYDIDGELLAYESFGPVDANNSVLTFTAGSPQAGRVVVRVP